MALCRRDEPDRTMPMLVVVPLHKGADPLPGGQEGGKGAARVRGPVFQGLEQGLRIRVVVADCRPAEGRRDAQRLQGGEHGRTLHRAAVIGMQHDLIRCDAVLSADIAHHFAGLFATFGIINLPADDFTAKNVHEQVQVKIAASHVGPQ